MAYSSTVSYGGTFTMGDWTYALPPIIIKGQGTASTWNMGSNYFPNAMAMMNGFMKASENWTHRVKAEDMAWTLSGVRADGPINYIGSAGDLAGVFDIGGQVISTWEPENRYLAMAAGIVGAIALRKPGLAKVDAYAGVKEASLYLQSAGVPRAYRKQILESFEIGTISLKTAGKSTYGIRFYGGAAKESGRYLFPTFDDYINRTGLALPPSWNSMSNFSQFKIAPGTSYIFGRAASQGGIYTGGSYQMYVNDLKNLVK